MTEKVDLAKVKDKIQKLLALSHSSNEHEAALAAQRAGEILAKYDLSMQEVEAHVQGDDELVTITEIDPYEQVNSKLQWEGSLAASLADIFECKCVRTTIKTPFGKEFKLEFMGVKHDVAITVYFFRYLRLRIQKESEKLQSKKDRYQFALGMIITITKRLNEMKRYKTKAYSQASEEARQNNPEFHAMIPVEKALMIQDQFDKRHPDIKPAPEAKFERQRMDKVFEGMRKGEKVALSTPIENNHKESEVIDN